MKTNLKQRLKGLLALTLSAAVLVGNGITVAADEPTADYTYECAFYSYADLGYCNNSLRQNDNNKLFTAIKTGSGDRDEDLIFDYNYIGKYSSYASVIKGGNSLNISLSANDSDNRYTLPQTEQFNIWINGALTKEYSLAVEPGQSVSKEETFTLGKSGSYYVWTLNENGNTDESRTWLEQRLSNNDSGNFYLKPETEASPFVYNMYLKEVYDVQVPAESGTMDYASDTVKRVAGPRTYFDQDRACSFNKFALPGEKVLIGAESGATIEALSHLEVRKYNADMTDYEVVPLSELQLDSSSEYASYGFIAEFVMPEGNISVLATTDESALQDDYFVARYSVAAKAATCTAAGNLAYVKCPVCGKYFVKEGDSWTEKTEAEISTPAKNHKNLKKIEAKAASCTEAGNIEYYECQDCGLFFSDSECKHEINKEDTVLASKKHANLKKIDAKDPTCTDDGNIEYYECQDCGVLFKDSECKQEIKKADTVVAKKGHSFVTKVIPATLDTEGSTYQECSLCKLKKDEAVIAKPVVTLEKSTFTYNNKAQLPKVVVKDTNGIDISEDSYTVTYENTESKAVGNYKVTVKLSGNYDGTVELAYTIRPKTIALKKSKVTKNSIKLMWKRNSSVKGYEIQCSTDKSFASAIKKLTVKKNSKTTAIITKLKAGKTYYFRARTYTTVDKKKVTSPWSSTLTITTKKK